MKPSQISKRNVTTKGLRSQISLERTNRSDEKTKHQFDAGDSVADPDYNPLGENNLESILQTFEGSRDVEVDNDGIETLNEAGQFHYQ